MRKNILIFIITIILIMPLTTKALSNDSYIDWTLDRSVFAHQYRNGEDHITNLAWIEANGKTAYCIEPGIMADKASYYSSSNNINDTGLSGVDTKKLSLIGYYGYGYKNHNTKEYYMATQELIWRFMGVENVWWTDQKEGGNTYNLDSYKNEIMNLVNNYEKAPLFGFHNKYIIGDTISLSDKNNVLEEYEVSNGDVKITGNEITLDVKKEINSFTLSRKKNGKNPIYYYKSGYQTIGSFEYAYDYSKTYTYTGQYGKIIVDKLDFDTKSKEVSGVSSDATLGGAEYGLYKNNDLIQTKKTDEKGRLEFNNLEKGSYMVLELNPSRGYNVSPAASVTNLGSTWYETTIESYEKIIKNKIIITKYLDDDETCIKEAGIWFSLYDLEGNLILKDITDENGNITFELNYGSYILKQESTYPNVLKVGDLRINVTEDGVVQNFVLTNHKIKKETYNYIESSKKEECLPNTGKKDFLFSLFLLPISFFGLINEKKYI